MKYIRTKDDKIFLIHEDLDNKDLWYFESKEKTIVISCNPSDLGKVADTIEELCDLFIGIYKDEEEIEDKEIGHCFDFFQNEKSFKEIYGAIWTKKGLIYVAKMNDKGELELC